MQHVLLRSKTEIHTYEGTAFAQRGGTSNLNYIEFLNDGRRMDLQWSGLDKECKYWTDRNAKALFRTDIEKELPKDIASGRNFEWVAPKAFWTEAQFQDMAIDLYKADKLPNVKDALKIKLGTQNPSLSQVENFIRNAFKVCCP